MRLQGIQICSHWVLALWPPVQPQPWLLLNSTGGAPTAGLRIKLETSWDQRVIAVRSFFSQVFLVVFVARMIGLHTGRR